MPEIHTEIGINASPEKVWNILTDFSAFPEWNTFMPSAEGELEEGARLNVVVRPMGGKGMTIKPTVLKVDENRELRWRGALLLNGLFSGEHSFIIQGVSEGKVRFMHSESFKGVLAPLMWPIIRKSTRRGFEAMNEALRDRAEGKAPSADSPPEEPQSPSEEPPTETETPS